jgi:predicted dehydrogenase
MSVGIAVVGTGQAAGCHVRAVEQLPDAELVCAVSRTPDRPAPGISAPLTTLDEALLDPRVAIVVVASPNGRHAADVRAALNAGRHVLVEKPLALDAGEALQLGRLADSKGCRLGVVMPRRFDRSWATVVESVHRGDLGSVRWLDVDLLSGRSSEYYTESEWRGSRELDGGVVLTQAIHHLDVAAWIAGADLDVTRLSFAARGIAIRHDIDGYDTVIGTVDLGRLTLSLRVSTGVCDQEASRVVVAGDQGTMTIMNDEFPAGDRATTVGWDVRASAAVLTDFVAAVRGGCKPRCTARAAARALALAVGFTAAASGSSRRAS